MSTNRTTEAGKIIRAAIDGDHGARGIIKSHVMGTPTSYLESFSTSDLVQTFTVAVNQQTEQQYADMPRVWDKIAKRNQFSDFREQEVVEFDWNKPLDVVEQAGRQVVPGGLAVVPEGTEYPTFGYSTAERRVKLHKHGARMPFLFEYVINDQWNILNSLPAELNKKALQTEEIEIGLQLVNQDGIRPDVFSGVAAPSNRALTLDALRDAKTEVAYRQVNGRYVRVNKWALVVPTTLKDVAQDVLSITSYDTTVEEGGETRTFRKNVSNGDVELVVMDVLLDIDQSASAPTTWFLVPAGGSDGTRDSLVQNFLTGHETPELRVHGNTGNYLGGGAVDFKQGSFLNDDLQYRVRHIVTGSVSHNDALFASTGTD